MVYQASLLTPHGKSHLLCVVDGGIVGGGKRRGNMGLVCKIKKINLKKKKYETIACSGGEEVKQCFACYLQ